MQGTSLPAINRNNATSCTDGLPLKHTISDVLTRWCVERGGWNKIQRAQATNVNKAGQGHYDYIHTMCVPTTHHLNLRFNYLTPANSSFMNCSVHWMLPDTNRTTSTATTILPVPERE